MTKKLIRLADFIKLTQERQFDILHQDGVYVGKRKMAKQTVVLFQLYAFYVEVFYSQYRKQADRVVVSEDPEFLLPYIDQVHVKDLGQNAETKKQDPD